MEFHVNTVFVPWIIWVGFAVRETERNGDCEGATTIVTLSETDPPFIPKQDTVYVCVEKRLLVDRKPEVPLQPVGKTVQEVTFCEVHETDAGVLYARVTEFRDPFARISTLANVCWFTNTVALAVVCFPFTLLHIIVYTLATEGFTVWDPESAFVPDHAPVA